MKNMAKLAGIIAIVAIIGFSFTACDNGGGGGGGGGGDGDEGTTPVFSVSGTFNKGGGKNVAFSLTDAAAYSRSVRTVTSDTYAVKGELEDGDFTIRLSGTYDPTDRTYTASASAESLGIRYTINGAYDASGNSAGSSATLAVKNQTTGEWTATTYIVNEAAAVNITGEAEDSEPGGIPAFARGNWYYDMVELGYVMRMKFLMNQWNISVDAVITRDGQTDYNTTAATIIETDDKGGGKYNVIFAFPIYVPTDANQVAAAVDDFFKDKGVTPTRTMDMDWTDGSKIPQSASYFINEDDDYSICWINFGQDQWRLVDQFYNTNHLDKYLISKNVAPTTMFEKSEFQFSSNDTVLTWKMYCTPVTDDDDDWVNYDYDTLAEAKAATKLDNNFVYTLTRK